MLFEVKIRDSNTFDEIAHINKKPLKDLINVVNCALQKEGMNERIVLKTANAENGVKT